MEIVRSSKGKAPKLEAKASELQIGGAGTPVNEDTKKSIQGPVVQARLNETHDSVVEEALAQLNIKQNNDPVNDSGSRRQYSGAQGGQFLNDAPIQPPTQSPAAGTGGTQPLNNPSQAKQIKMTEAKRARAKEEMKRLGDSLNLRAPPAGHGVGRAMPGKANTVRTLYSSGEYRSALRPSVLQLVGSMLAVGSLRDGTTSGTTIGTFKSSPRTTRFRTGATQTRNTDSAGVPSVSSTPEKAPAKSKRPKHSANPTSAQGMGKERALKSSLSSVNVKGKGKGREPKVESRESDEKRGRQTTQKSLAQRQKELQKRGRALPVQSKPNKEDSKEAKNSQQPEAQKKCTVRQRAKEPKIGVDPDETEPKEESEEPKAAKERAEQQRPKAKEDLKSVFQFGDPGN